MKRYITFILLAVLAVCANAQIRVSGTVTDGSGEPLIGAVTDNHKVFERFGALRENHINCSPAIYFQSLGFETNIREG